MDMKLTAAQQVAYLRLRLSEWKTAYELGCRMDTLNAEVSMARGKWRGHEIAFVQGTWIYADTGLPVSDEPGRKCGHCGADNCDDECDPCLGNLPGVMNACCGHGDRDSSYIQFVNGVIVSGFAIDG